MSLLSEQCLIVPPWKGSCYYWWWWCDGDLDGDIGDDGYGGNGDYDGDDSDGDWLFTNDEALFEERASAAVNSGAEEIEFIMNVTVWVKTICWTLTDDQNTLLGDPCKPVFFFFFAIKFNCCNN